MDPLATAFLSVGGSQEALAILREVGVTNFDVVRHSSDTPAEFAVAVIHLAARHKLPPISPTDEASLEKLYRVAVGPRGVKAAAFASANPTILSPLGAAPDFGAAPLPPSDLELVDLSDDEDARHRQELGVKRRHVIAGPFKRVVDEPVVKSLLSLAAQTGRRLRGASLLELEQAKTELWGARLLRIIFRAKVEVEARGEFLPIITEVQESTETTSDALELLKRVAQTGAWRTIRGHVYAFGRIEAFVQLHGRPGESVYPCKASTIVRYLMSLRNVGLKPTVPASMKGSVIWVHKLSLIHI